MSAAKYKSNPGILLKPKIISGSKSSMALKAFLIKFLHKAKMTKKEFKNLGITKAHVSLSDTENYVVAFVVLET